MSQLRSNLEIQQNIVTYRLFVYKYEFLDSLPNDYKQFVLVIYDPCDLSLYDQIEGFKDVLLLQYYVKCI